MKMVLLYFKLNVDNPKIASTERLVDVDAA
jgi:hypothetical protein